MSDEIELMLELGLWEHSHSTAGFTASAEVGERLRAAAGRVDGPARLAALLGRLPAALRAGGWDGKDACAARLVDADHDEGAGGREWALRRAIADAEITAPAASPDADAARAAFSGEAPDGACSFASEDGCLKVRLRYLGGTASNGRAELAKLLGEAGFRASEA
jgi:hypothetical protein